MSVVSVSAWELTGQLAQAESNQSQQIPGKRWPRRFWPVAMSKTAQCLLDLALAISPGWWAGAQWLPLLPGEGRAPELSAQYC